MAASKILTQDTIASIVADWKTGNFTQRDLAYKYKLSVGAVNKHTKGLNKEHEQLVNKLVEAKQELSQLDERSVHAVNEIVEERTKHIQFFTNATINNLRMMESKINEGTSIVEHKIAQEAIAKGRETVLGKQPETQVNIQNNAPSQQSMMNLQEYAQINAELNDLV